MSELEIYEVDYTLAGSMRIKAANPDDASRSVLDELEYQIDETNLDGIAFQIEEIKKVL